jgi:hypothetical protein
MGGKREKVAIRSICLPGGALGVEASPKTLRNVSRVKRSPFNLFEEIEKKSFAFLKRKTTFVRQFS